MNKTETTVSAGYIIGVPILIASVLILVMLVVGATFVQAERLSVTAIPIWTLVTVGMGGFLAALIAACRALRAKLLWGLAAGVVLLMCLIVCSLLWVGQPIDTARVLTVSSADLCAALIGSFIGASRLKRKRKK